MQRRRDHRHAVDRVDLGQRLEVLLGAADVGLEAGVAALDDVAGPGLAPAVTLEVPVHDVPAAGAEPELDGGGVHHDAVAQLDRSGELRQRVGALGPAAEVDLDALQPAPCLEQLHDLAGPERRHPGRLRAYKLAMRRSTRSSRDLNGSLHRTVRCAWSLSFRCTQSTV